MMTMGLSSSLLLGVPPAPTGVKASDGLYPTFVQVEWDDVTGVEWEVWRGTANDLSQAVLLSDEWWNWFMDYNASPGTLYYYWIRAFDGSGKSAFSAPDTGYAGEGANPGDGYALEVSSPNGQVYKNPDMTKYPPGTQVTLTAVPNQGYKFVGWQGGVTGDQNPITLTLQANTTLQAMFELSAPPTGGRIRILIEPPGAVQSGAQWRFSNQNNWRNSGDQIDNLPFDTYTVVLKDIPGWSTPPSQTIQVAANLPSITWTVNYQQSTNSTGDHTPPSLQIHLHPGVTLTGVVGQRCQILATPNLTQTNTWTPLGEVLLTNRTQVWFDPVPARELQKLYKAVLLP